MEGYYCPICGAYVGKILREIAYDTSLGYRDTCEFECPNGHELEAQFTWAVTAIRLTRVGVDAAINSHGEDRAIPAAQLNSDC